MKMIIIAAVTGVVFFYAGYQFCIKKQNDTINKMNQNGVRFVDTDTALIKYVIWDSSILKKGEHDLQVENVTVYKF